ncbi:hypothetical protein C8R47DRAFT_1158464 [Mycena vitilis]|nr:hypothetical protein C8R47DRAFT_1158464 [Mycena vitilis]
MLIAVRRRNDRDASLLCVYSKNNLRLWDHTHLAIDSLCLTVAMDPHGTFTARATTTLPLTLVYIILPGSSPPLITQLVMSSLDFPPVHDVKNKALGHLRPLTPTNRGRYDKAFDPSLQLNYLTIPAGLDLEHSLPQLREGWSSYIHPEGQPYFHRCSDGVFQVVTESQIQDAGVLERLVPYLDEIQRLLVATRSEMSVNLELYVQLEEEGCGYYLVEHAARKIFWLHEQCIKDLAFWPVASTRELDPQIKVLYWTHVEYFPNHFGPNGLGHEWIEDLLDVFAHGRLDQLTSPDSTFPYSVEHCGHIIESLKCSQDRISSGYIICLSARMWHLVWDVRAMDMYGSPHARLGRSQAVRFDPATRWKSVSVLGRLLSFDLFARYLVKLNDVFADEVVVTFRWQAMIASCIRGWKAARQTASVTLLLHIFVFVLPGTDITVVTASAVLLVASLITATALIHVYEPLENMTVDEAVSYLGMISSPTAKFQFVALTFSLPGALSLWGLLAVLVNFGIVFTISFGIHSAIVMFAACGLVMFLFLWTTSAVFKSRLIDLFTDVTWFSELDSGDNTSLVDSQVPRFGDSWV